MPTWGGVHGVPEAEAREDRGSEEGTQTSGCTKASGLPSACLDPCTFRGLACHHPEASDPGKC